MAMRSRRARGARPGRGRRCPTCGRGIESVLDLRSVTVVAVRTASRPRRGEDAPVVAKAAALPAFRAYLEHLRRLVGRTVPAAALWPAWPDEWHGLVIPGSPRTFMDIGPSWTLELDTDWRPRLRALVRVQLVVTDGFSVVLHTPGGTLADIEVQGHLGRRTR